MRGAEKELFFKWVFWGICQGVERASYGLHRFSCGSRPLALCFETDGHLNFDYA